MKPKLHVIHNEKGIAEAYSALLSYDSFVAYDTETTGVHHGCKVIGLSFCGSDTDAYYIVLDRWNKETKALEPMLRNHGLVEKILLELKNKALLMHNGIFDCSVTEQNFKIPLIEALHTDNMVLAHLLDENRRIGLKELGTELLGQDATKEQIEMKANVLANGGIWTKKNKEMYKADWQVIGKYGAKDAWLTYTLFFLLAEELLAQGLEKFFYEDESMPLLRGPTYQLNTIGLRVDQEALQHLKQVLQAECVEAKAFILQEINVYIKGRFPGTSKKNVFNIGSSQQLSWLMFGQLKLEFNTLTKGGKAIARYLIDKVPYSKTDKEWFIDECTRRVGEVYEPESIINGKKKRAKKIKDPWCYIACDKTTLGKFKNRYKWVEKLLEFSKKQKILKTYVTGIQERMQYGIIRPSFLQTGTTSGRYSSKAPNFQNLPRDDKRVKACIVARPGKVFVGADYSQLEPRVFADYSGDMPLIECFDKREDFYAVVGMPTFKKFDCTPQKEGSQDAFGIKYKSLRDKSKVVALSSTYGSLAQKLAPTVGMSIEDTQQVIDDYFEAFPGVKKFQLSSHELVKKQGYVENLFGRRRRIPDAKHINKLYGKKDHADLPYEARSLLNLAVNHQIQSTGASIINRAMIKFYENCQVVGIDCQLVLQVHDSLVIECSEYDAKDVALLLQDAMEHTVQLKSVRLEAEPKIGNNISLV